LSGTKPLSTAQNDAQPLRKGQSAKVTETGEEIHGESGIF